MPSRKLTTPIPTDAELAILRVLWDRRTATVRDVHEALAGASGSRRPTAYTTTLKFLQIMTEKGLVCRDEAARSHVYRAALPEAQTQRRLVRDLLDRAFGGATHKLVMQALSAKRATSKEVAEIRRILDAYQPDEGGHR